MSEKEEKIRKAQDKVEQGSMTQREFEILQGKTNSTSEENIAETKAPRNKRHKTNKKKKSIQFGI